MPREERRRHVRLGVGTEVEYTPSEGSATVRVSTETRNISPLGLRLVVFERLPVGKPVSITINLPRCGLLGLRPRKKVHANGKVIWVNLLKVGDSHSEHAWEIGLEFTRIAPLDMALISRYMRSRRRR